MFTDRYFDFPPLLKKKPTKYFKGGVSLPFTYRIAPCLSFITFTVVPSITFMGKFYYIYG